MIFDSSRTFCVLMFIVYKMWIFAIASGSQVAVFFQYICTREVIIHVVLASNLLRNSDC